MCTVKNGTKRKCDNTSTDRPHAKQKCTVKNISGSKSDDISEVQMDPHVYDPRKDGVWPFQFHSVDQQWQRNACSTLGIDFIQPNGLSPGGPTVPLTRPDPKDIVQISGDGNCMFRAFSYIISGSQNHHMKVREAILKHMEKIAPLMLKHIDTYTSVPDYISGTKMNLDRTWGTQYELYALSHLLGTSIFTYLIAPNPSHSNWVRYAPHNVQRTLSDDKTKQAMYIRNVLVHYEVVGSVKKHSNGAPPLHKTDNNLTTKPSNTDETRTKTTSGKHPNTAQTEGDDTRSAQTTIATIANRSDSSDIFHSVICNGSKVPVPF